MGGGSEWDLELERGNRRPEIKLSGVKASEGDRIKLDPGLLRETV